jgi:transcriptional regulator of acetoin/glycerol metabolism
MSSKLGRFITDIDSGVIKCLENYEWPGNIRELQNVVERILLVAEDRRITIEHLPREIVNVAIGHSRDRWESTSAISVPGSSNRSTRKLYALEQEKESIIRALDLHGGNISKAAVELGISRNTLYRKMKNYNTIN